MKNYLLCLLFLVLSGTLTAQDRQITGTITDEEGHPVTGAVIQTLNAEEVTGAVSDDTGTYTLRAQTGDSLKVSMVGLKDWTGVLSDTTSTLDIVLSIEDDIIDCWLPILLPQNYRHNLTWVQGMDLGHGVLEYRQHLYGIGRKSSAAERFLFRIIEPGLSWYTGTEDFFSIFTQLNDFPIGNSTLLNRQLMPYINLGWTVDQRFQKGKPRAELGLEINPLPKGSIRRFHVHLDARYRITQLPSAIDGLSYSRLYAGISLRYRPHYR